MERYTLGLQAAPTNVDLLAASASIERTRGRFEEALVHLQLASRLDPRNLTAAQNLARTYRDCTGIPTPTASTNARRRSRLAIWRSSNSG